MHHFHLVTLFPEFFSSPLNCGLLAKAQEKGLISFSFHNPRKFSDNRHQHIDDRPYGGGPGMVMQAEPVGRAVLEIPGPGRIILLSAGGRTLTQALACSMAKEEHLTLICGRYEGIDQRLEGYLEANDRSLEAISLCDAVLNGGESAALAIVEAVARLIPGFMGKEESSLDESFSAGCLEFPQYTRPPELNGLAVPDVLLSGDHGRIKKWQRRESLAATLALRPELLAQASLDENDQELLRAIPRERAGRNLSFCLIHYPVQLEQRKIGTSSLTNLDIHDIARISRSYGMGPFYVLSPLPAQIELLAKILEHWLEGPGAKNNPARKKALELVRPVTTLEEALADTEKRCGVRPTLLASSAAWPKGAGEKGTYAPLTPKEALGLCQHGPVLLCLGTAGGLAADFISSCAAKLRPLRFLNENHLSVRAAAAIYADRILGDFN